MKIFLIPLFATCCLMTFAQVPNDSIFKEEELGEVVVKAKKVIVMEDKLAVFPPMDLKRNAHDGYSALALLSIPGLQVDPMESIVKTHGVNTTLCINGREVSADEVRTLNPGDIKRIDYYPNHDPAHPMAQAVVDFILKRYDSGGQTYANAKSHLNVEKADAVVDQKVYYKNSEFNVQLSGDWSHYKLRRGEEDVLTMDLPAVQLTRTSDEIPSPIHANTGAAKLSWLYSTERDMLQVAAYVNKGHNADTHVMRQTFSSGQEERIAVDNTHTDHISPAFQVYFQRNTKSNGMLRASLYGNYNHTKVGRGYLSDVDYISHANEDFYYINPNFMYGMTLGKHRPFIDAMYRHSVTMNSYEENGVKSRSKLIYGQSRVTLGDNIRMANKLRMTLQLTGQSVYINNGYAKDTKFYFTPSIFYGIQLPKGNSIQGYIGYGTYDPELKYYNSSEQRIDQYQIISGNPDIKTSSTLEGQLMFNSIHEWGAVGLFAHYQNVSHVIYEDVVWDDSREAFLHTYRNGGFYHRFIASAELTLNITKGLSWNCSGEYYLYKEKNWENMTVSHFVGATGLTYFYKNFQAKVQYISPLRNLGRGYKYWIPAQLRLSAGVTLGRWHLDLSAKNPFWNSPEEVTYMKEGFKHFENNYNARLSSNVFLLSVAYRFSFGKERQFMEVQMDNKVRTGLLVPNSRH